MQLQLDRIENWEVRLFKTLILSSKLSVLSSVKLSVIVLKLSVIYIKMNHYIFDIKTKRRINTDDIENIFQQIIDLLNLNILAKKEHIFPNWWFTMFWLLAESHISAHYRIEDNYLALDIYSCRNLEKDEKEILDLIKELWEFKVTKLNRRIII